MNTYADKIQKSIGFSVANEASQNIYGEKSFNFIDGRPKAVAQRKLQEMACSYQRTKQLAAIQGGGYDGGQKTTGVAQCALVAQLATRLSSAVQFRGGAEVLRLLILQWGPPSGTDVQVTQTDYVGGTYKVRFTRDNGAISKKQADQWVQAGLVHDLRSESSSDGYE